MEGVGKQIIADLPCLGKAFLDLSVDGTYKTLGKCSLDLVVAYGIALGRIKCGRLCGNSIAEFLSAFCCGLCSIFCGLFGFFSFFAAFCCSFGFNSFLSCCCGLGSAAVAGAAGCQ